LYRFLLPPVRLVLDIEVRFHPPHLGQGGGKFRV
jgi:hypothetical protein